MRQDCFDKADQRETTSAALSERHAHSLTVMQDSGGALGGLTLVSSHSEESASEPAEPKDRFVFQRTAHFYGAHCLCSFASLALFWPA